LLLFSKRSAFLLDKGHINAAWYYLFAAGTDGNPLCKFMLNGIMRYQTGVLGTFGSCQDGDASDAHLSQSTFHESIAVRSPDLWML